MRHWQDKQYPRNPYEYKELLDRAFTTLKQQVKRHSHIHTQNRRRIRLPTLIAWDFFLKNKKNKATTKVAAVPHMNKLKQKRKGRVFYA